MLISFARGQTSIVLRVKILDSAATTGAGKTGLTFSSSGLIISTIADNEATATSYTQAGSTIETITTLGTYAAPTATKCRFKEVDATNHKGVYEIQIADARFAVSNAKSLLISILGATGAAETDALIPLTSLNPYDAVRAGLTALPNVAAGASGGLPLAVDSSGRVDVLKVNGTSQTARDLGASVLLSSGTGAGQVSLLSGRVAIRSNTVTNTGLNNFEFAMVDTSGAPRTGLAVTGQRSIDGGVFGPCTNSAAELSNGLYKIDLSASDLNGSVITLRFIATGAQDRLITVVMVP